MSKRTARHIREKLTAGSPLLCGGGHCLDASELKSVALTKWKYQKGDCGRCVNVVKKRMG